jgi:hypothetical protein
MAKTAATKKVAKQTATFAEFGQSGLKRQTGFVREEFLPELRGLRGLKIYTEMSSNDNIVRSMLFAIEMMIRSVEWRVEPASEEPEDIEQAEFLETVIDDMSVSWVDLVAEILSFLPFGWSYHEIVYKRREGPGRDPTRRSKFDDGKIGWRKIPIRAQETLVKWQFDDSGGLDAMVQRVQGQVAPVVIPIEKALLFRTSTQKQSPEGPSILRGAYRAWFFKKRIEEIEAVGLERDLAGFPIIYVPPGIMDANASAADKALFDDYQNIIRNLRRDEQEGLILPGSRDDKGHRWFELILLSTGGRRQFDTGKILERYSRWIAMTVLADFILLGHEKVGSFSLSSDKTALFATALGAWLDSIAAVFNDHGIPRLFALNGVSFEHQPTLAHGDIESVNLDELGKWLTSLASAGIDVTDENTEAWFRALAGMPEALREDDGAEGEEEDEDDPETRRPASPSAEELEEDARRAAGR